MYENVYEIMRQALIETKASPETMRLFETIVELRISNSSQPAPVVR